jgi:hypothetical protein
MQTVVLMAYLDSIHFSDPKTYKILCILSYGLKDTNNSRFAYLQGFFLRKEMENDTAGLDLEAGSLPAALDARLGRILMASQKKRPRGARDSGERSRAKAHLAPDLTTKSWD